MYIKDVRTNLIDTFKVFIRWREYSNYTFCVGSLENFLEDFIKNILCIKNVEDLKKSIFYKYLKDNKSITELEFFGVGCLYTNTEYCETLPDIILIDTIISNIYSGFDSNIERYCNTLFCIRELIEKYNLLKETFDILDNISFEEK